MTPVEKSPGIEYRFSCECGYTWRRTRPSSSAPVTEECLSCHEVVIGRPLSRASSKVVEAS